MHSLKVTLRTLVLLISMSVAARAATAYLIGDSTVSLYSSSVFPRMGITTIGDLVQKNDQQFLKMDGLEREHLRELKKALSALGLSLGIKL